MKQNTDMWWEEMEKKLGWYAHFIFDDPSYPYSVNIHTHLFPDKFGHPDLQICYPLSKESAYNLLLSIAETIRVGKFLAPGMVYSDLLMNYKVEIAEAEDDGRKVMRIIFPDKEGNIQTYDGKANPQFDGCKKQFTKN